MKRIGILVAAETSYQSILRALVETTTDLKIAGESDDEESLCSLIRQLDPDVVLVDLALKFRPDTGVLRNLLASRGRSMVLVEAIQTSQVLQAIQLGALAIIPKSAASDQIRRHIRAVGAGNYFLTSEVAGILVRTLQEVLVEAVPTPTGNGQALTRREMEIVEKVCAGLSNRAVGEEFCISERTVKHHLTNIFTKIGVSNRLALALFAIDHNLVVSRALDKLADSRS